MRDHKKQYASDDSSSFPAKLSFDSAGSDHLVAAEQSLAGTAGTGAAAGRFK